MTILDLVRRHAAPLPRYTSYPTANHFTPSVGAGEYRQALANLKPASKLSLYVHIPYCQELCWYCGCSTKAVRRYEPISDYLTQIEAEISALEPLIPPVHGVSHVHWGGGSPDILSPADIERLGGRIRAAFKIEESAEFAVEIDPRLLRRDQVASFARIGVNRISIGVQDFDQTVQKAIGRTQSYEVTKRAVDGFREVGVDSINVDLVYGLPHQTEDSVARTIEQVLTLGPERIAIFGYAHLPTRLKHQRLIDEAALPGPVERFQQSQRLATVLAGAGYLQIGLDHFARPSDTLAAGHLARNFQGYTTDRADALIGIGASSISRLPEGYFQNAVAVDEHARRLEKEGLATARGWLLTEDDKVRAYVIEKLMCDFSFSSEELLHRYGDTAQPVLSRADTAIATDRDGFVERTSEGFRLTERGRPFVRNICAQFDAYLTQEVASRRHALSV